MMNCQCTRQALQDQFDAGLPLAEGLDAHLEACRQCQAYLDRLLALDAALNGLPLERPSSAFAGRIGERVDSARIAAEDRRAVLSPAAIVIVAVSVAAWYFQLGAHLTTWGTWALAMAPPFDWREVGAGLFNATRTLPHLLTRRFTTMPELPWAPFEVGLRPLYAWGAAALTAASLVILNGLEARRLRNVLAARLNVRRPGR